MLGFEQLERRLRSRGLGLVEPDGQDGRLCQYIAIIHQLKLNHAPAVQATSNAYAMESHMLWWLDIHGADITSVHAIRGDEAELSLLRDSWTDIDLHALCRRPAPRLARASSISPFQTASKSMELAWIIWAPFLRADLCLLPSHRGSRTQLRTSNLLALAG